MKLRSGRTYIIKSNFNNNKFIILDIDHTLIHSKRIDPTIKFGEFGDFNICDNEYTIYKRPYVDKFIEWCFNNFNGILVWSAGTKIYVDNVVKYLFKSPLKPIMILTRKNCSINYSNNRYYKDFSTLDATLKNLGISPNTSKMFFVDDLPHRIKNLNSQYIIPIKPYWTRRHIWRDRSFSGDRDNHLLKIMKMSYNI
uniref:Ctd-like phosphatase n=1 Tax=Mimivirus LCMiAC01 TaxID=2506608 RepID=A0A481YZP5_9VIRU|nr:MAG: ctd-like phosphatase [Mimivirus LCMiAC01]